MFQRTVKQGYGVGLVVDGILKEANAGMKHCPQSRIVCWVLGWCQMTCPK